MEKSIYKGVYDALDPSKHNLYWFVVPSMSTRSHEYELYEEYHKGVFEMGIDAVVVHSATVGFQSSEAQMLGLLKQYGDIPIVNIGQKLGHYPYISIDNRQGMLELIEYLIEKQNCQSFAFIKGPTDNLEANERYMAYRDTLERFDIDPTDQIELAGNFAPNFTRDLMHQWVPLQSKLPDVIVCCNDMAAKETIEVLQAYGYRVPDQVMVTGFDDFEYAIAMPVPLSTVNQPLLQEGYEAGVMIRSQLENKPCKRHIELPTKAVLRQSTGSTQIEDKQKNLEQPDYWEFIQLRDLQLGRQQLMRQMMERGDTLQNIQKSCNALYASGIDHLFVFIRDEGKPYLSIEIEKGVVKPVIPGTVSENLLTNNRKIRDDNTDLHWVILPLLDESYHYGFLVAHTDQKDIEYTEAFGEQISVLLANEYLQQQAEMINNQIVQNEKMAALGGLVSGVAHEVNTPLGNSLLAASNVKEEVKRIRKLLDSGQLTKRDFDNFVESSEIATNILEHNLFRAADLITNFKQVAVDQTVEEKRELDLGEYLNSVFSSLSLHAKNSKVQIERNFEKEVIINTYPGTWAQIFSNIFLNCFKHGLNGGKESGTIKINLFTEQDNIALTISDNGQGMSEKVKKHIFDPFFTTKRGQGGTGLGMHIVFNLCAQRLNGTIEVTSKPKVGSEFIVRVPKLPPEPMVTLTE